MAEVEVDKSDVSYLFGAAHERVSHAVALGGFPGDAFTPCLRQLFQCVLL